MPAMGGHPGSARPSDGPSEGLSGGVYTGLRRDLQGVRGFGVTLVVVGHLFRYPHGVFAALDIFFVLSGYLITMILLGQLPRHGPRFFAAFYAGRARRLMPMALLVLAVTVLATYAVFSSSRGRDVLGDALWAAVFGVNWHFAAEGTDYFSPTATSPLLHYWSLSVEEQFYLAWPLLLLGALALAGRAATERGRALAIGGVLGAVATLSLGYSLWHSAVSPTAAYFSTFDRAWEFAAGGLVAVAAPGLVRLPRTLRRTAAWLAVPGLLVTIFALDPSVPFPAPWGLLPVLLTVAIIVGGLDGQTRYLWLADNRVMAYVGDISYSVYLWHLPLIVLLVPFFAPGAVTYYAAVLVGTFALASLSFHFVERPLRRSRRLMLPAERRMRPDPVAAAPATRPAWQSSVRGWALAASFVGVLMMVASIVRGPAGEVATAETVAEEMGQRDRIAAALGATTFPAFEPSLDELRTLAWEQLQENSGCAQVDLDDLESCTFGTEPSGREQPTVAVYGDSVAAAWVPTVRAAFEPAGWEVQQLTLEQCGPWELPSYVEQDGTPYPACAEFHGEVLDLLAEDPPDLLVSAAAVQQVRNAERPDLDATPQQVAERGLAAMLAELPDALDVVVLGPPPQLAGLLECVSRVGSPAQCTASPNDDYRAHVAGESAAAAEAGATYVPTESWFCVGGRCPGFVGSTPVTVEGTHLTPAFARTLGPLLAGALAPHVEGLAGRARAGTSLG